MKLKEQIYSLKFAPKLLNMLLNNVNKVEQMCILRILVIP
jgi:uncharacterized UPF0146 family protein